MPLTKVTRIRAGDAVLDILREGILHQTFLPGQRLDVRALGEELGVSLTPIKEAITRLAAEGFIELRPRSGTYVSQISVQEIEDTLAVRRALECLAAETVPANITSQDLKKLGELVAQLEVPMKTGPQRQLHERRNNEFHLRIVELSRNRKLVDLYSNLNAHIKMARVHQTSKISPQRVAEECREHRVILAALAARDASALKAALNEHIARASAALVNDLKTADTNRKSR